MLAVMTTPVSWNCHLVQARDKTSEKLKIAIGAIALFANGTGNLDVDL